MNTGAAIFTLRSQPYSVLTSTEGKVQVSGVGADSRGETVAAQGVTLDIQVGIVDRVVLVAASSHFAERSRVEQLPATEGGLEDLAVP